MCAHISESKHYFNVKSSAYYFHMKPKILADFQICISVPLKTTTAMNPKISVVVISVETSIYLLLRNLHGCSFKIY